MYFNEVVGREKDGCLFSELFKSVNFIKLRSKGFCYNWVLLNMLLFLENDGTHNFSKL